MKRKRVWKSVLLIGLAFLVLMYPYPMQAHGETVRYEAVLWGFRREKEVVETDVRGIAGKVKYYMVYKLRILVFPLEIKDTKHIHDAQW